MVKIVLSPSQQEANQYAGGITGYNDSEEFWMRKLAAEIKRRLDSHPEWGFQVAIVNKGSVGANVTASNALRPNLHLELHTDAGGGDGTTVFHHANSVKGLAAAKAIYPFVSVASNAPDNGIRGSLKYYALNQTTAPAIIIEHAFHDNVKEAQEIRTSIPEFADAVVKGLARLYGKTFTAPKPAPSAYLEAHIHLLASDRNAYAAFAAAHGDFIAFYPAPVGSWKTWPRGV